MKTQAVRMGMPVTIEVQDTQVKAGDITKVLSYFSRIDARFSPYKKNSEVTKINEGRLCTKEYSDLMKKIQTLGDKTKKETNGYFDFYQEDTFDPSGIVKGYAIYEGSLMLQKRGYKNFFVSIGGDIQTAGLKHGKKWDVGIENPFKKSEIIKIVYLAGEGIATSGTYIRGEHIYNPILKSNANEIKSITVIGSNILEADRFATAAFAMGKEGISFIEKKSGLEGYAINNNGIATFTSGFEKYLKQ